MARDQTKNRYAQTVGHIAIEWNYLEHDLQQLGFVYLTVEDDVASHIFAFMGNVTRAEFIEYLVDRFEKSAEVREHLHHLLALYNRLRGNRNVVEHGVPALSKSGAYLDEIIKIDRRGDALPFAASQETLDSFLKDLRIARRYASQIKALVDILADRPSSGEAAALEKPPMPARLHTAVGRPEED